MKKGITRALSVALLGGAVALWGCEKMAPAELSPEALPARSIEATVFSAEAHSPAQAAWLRFVDRVERGEQVDPAGQYVAKTTRLAAGAGGARVVRPKYEAGTPAFARRYRLQRNGEVTGQNTSATLGDDGPPSECEGCEGPGQGVPIPYTLSFTSSVNQGGSGYIHDLKIVTGGAGSGSTSQQVVLGGAGYTLLNADLNRGAGGAYIYLCFQRNSANVLSGLEYYQGAENSAPFDILTSFTTKNGSTFSKPGADSRYFDIWVPNQNPYYAWSYIDLNGGAGGEYIYSFQSKSNQIPVFNGYFSEVGILSGNSSTILPPAGWQKYPHDLNEGAGGDFIYFCYKY
jgi:hypothetical protein